MNLRNWLRWMLVDNSATRLGSRANASRFRHMNSAGLRPRLEILEDRLAPATISISDATAGEGPDAARFVDIPIRVGSSFGVPNKIILGPNGDYFVVDKPANSIRRYDGATFQYKGDFVASGAGGLQNPSGLVFANGDLFVASNYTDEVLRYNGQTGSFMGAFVSRGANGIAQPNGLLVREGKLYVSGRLSHDVQRYDLASGAFIDIFVPAGAGGVMDPVSLAFGPDGDFYISDRDVNGATKSILRYNGATGAFIGTFVPAGTGGLTLPTGITFGPDGNLYVCHEDPNTYGGVLRFNGTTGAFMDSLAPSDTGQPTGLLFINNQMMVCRQYANEVARYEFPSWAVFNVTLSNASTSPVAVQFSTASATATTGSDFGATSGTLTFAPGETSKTILVKTVDDSTNEPVETFDVNLSNPVGATIADGQGIGTIIDNEILTQFYVVNDASSDQIYGYGSTGAAQGVSSLAAGNTSPRGATNNVAGDRIWVADANKTVYVYSPTGAPLGSWAAGSLAANAEVEGLATNGTDIWIVDAKQDKVFKYTGSATRTSGSQNAASSFNLASGNNSPKGIVTDGTSIWVVNDSGTDKIYKYTMTGTLLGSWTITGAGSTPTGITLDPLGPGHLWLVDSGTDRVYEFSGALTRISGSQAASSSFTLDPGNTNPQDIADPVGVDFSQTATTTTLVGASPDPAAPTQALTFTATVTGGGVASGDIVELHDNANDGAVIASGTLANGGVTFTVPANTLALGKHDLVAVYAGNGTKAPSVSGAITQYTSDIPPAALVRSHFPEGTQTTGNFGTATAVDKDYYVVGMPAADVGGIPDVGAAYVYSRATGALVATLANPSPATHDDFGFSVAVSGNLVVVGADDFHRFGFDGIGEAYVFNAATGALLATLANPAPDKIALFGATVAISGNSVAVGGEARAGSIGQVFVFNATTGALTASLDDPAPAGTDDVFGLTVALSGATLVVGAPGDVPGSGSYGRAYVFNAATKQLIATLENPAPDDGDLFGFAVAVSGNTVVVSAPNDDAGATDSGQAYAFSATTGVLLANLANPSPATGDFFGDSVAVSGSVAVVGTPRDDTGATNSGQAYVFSATTGNLLNTLSNPSPASNDQFGSGVSIAGNTVVVGAANDDTANTDQGAAYVFTTAGAPVVTSVTVNGNIATLAGPQRWRVASLVVAFDQPVQLDLNAFTLALHTNNVRWGGVLQPAGYGSLPTSLNVMTTDNKTWIVTFSGNTDIGADGLNSLKDGVYNLTIDAAKVHVSGIPELTMAANQTTTFHRLYGDVNAPATPAGGTVGTDFEAFVNTVDNLAFRAAFNKPAGGGYVGFLDFNGDGIINTADNLQFRSRFNKALTWRT